MKDLHTLIYITKYEMFKSDRCQINVYLRSRQLGPGKYKWCKQCLYFNNTVQAVQVAWTVSRVRVLSVQL